MHRGWPERRAVLAAEPVPRPRRTVTFRAPQSWRRVMGRCRHSIDRCRHNVPHRRVLVPDPLGHCVVAGTDTARHAAAAMGPGGTFPALAPPLPCRAHNCPRLLASLAARALAELLSAALRLASDRTRPPFRPMCFCHAVMALAMSDGSMPGNIIPKRLACPAESC